MATEVIDREIEILKQVLHEVYNDCRVNVTYLGSSVTDGPDYFIDIRYRDCQFTSMYILPVRGEINDIKLAKCIEEDYNYNKGPFILRKIEEFARLIGVKTIKLNDLSTFSIPGCDVEFSLRTLYLLTKGMTWYHSQGYNANLGPDQLQVMNNQISVSMNEFTEKLKAKLVNDNDYVIRCDTVRGNDGEKIITKHFLDSLLNELNVSHLDLRTCTVKEYFTRISDMLKDEKTDCPTLTKIGYLLKFIFDSNMLLFYDAEKRLDDKATSELRGLPQQDEVELVLGADPGLPLGGPPPPPPLSKPPSKLVLSQRKNELRKKFGYNPKMGGNRTRKIRQKRRKTRCPITKTSRHRTRTHRGKTKIFSKKNKKARSFI